MLRNTFLLAILACFVTFSLPASAATEIKMIFVKGGCFEMGDILGEGDNDERPTHKVCVDDFYIGKYEVTQAQWQMVMGNNPSTFKGDDLPVENISWTDAMAFTRKLQKLTGRKYRLPYEAEWEYAARSGGKNEMFAGTSDMSQLDYYGWYADNSDRKTHPVGQLEPNGLGLYDMSGNVWEWCRDRYDANYYTRSPAENPRGSLTGEYRVARGGSWNDSPGLVRTMNRGNSMLGYRELALGFRLVLPAPRK